MNMFIAGFGVAKGVLMLKEGIDKIQIPKSMLKVQKSKSQHPLHNSVMMIVTEVFLSDKSITISRIIADNPKKRPTASGLKEVKPPCEMFTNVLLAAGVSKDTIDNCTYCYCVKLCW